MLQHWQDSTSAQSETAVVAALSFWDYSLVASVQGSDTYKATGRCFSVAAGRISYSYGLKGGSEAVPWHLLQPKSPERADKRFAI